MCREECLHCKKSGAYSKILETIGWRAKCLIEDITENEQDLTVMKTLFHLFFFFQKLVEISLYS